jgi:multidrug transporter EmrE-like cation transporter
MIRSALLFTLFILSSTAGEIVITYGMKATGEPERLRPRELLIFLGRALRNVWFWVGVPLLALSFYSLLLLLSWEPISLVIPASALNPYVFGTLAAKYVLGEQISPARWAGVTLVCAGVALVAVG